MSKVSSRQLAGIKVFSALQESALLSIAPVFGLHAFTRGQTIITHGERTSSVYFVSSGRVRATMFSPAGREVSYQDIGPGEMFGELAALDQLPRSTHVIGLSDGELLTVGREDFNRLLTSHPSVSNAVLLKMAGLVRFLCDRLYEYSALSVAERLRAELVRLARLQNTPAGQPIVINDMPTHEELANRLATHREAITRELGQLQKSGIVLKKRNQFTVVNMRALVSLVK